MRWRSRGDLGSSACGIYAPGYGRATQGRPYKPLTDPFYLLNIFKRYLMFMTLMPNQKAERLRTPELSGRGERKGGQKAEKRRGN